MGQQTWDEGFRLGIRKIDDEHATFLNIFNALEDAVSQGRRKAEVGKTIDELMLYAYNHFSDASQMISALTDWLIKHIQGTDKKYAPFFAAKGVD